MFEVLIVKPIFNLLVLIYALLPGHNFGLSIILFTVTVRFLMWPLIKKQLHHAKAMRELQPELKRIKKEANGDRQKESLMMMRLYKEREISPFGSMGILVVQLIILIGLYSGLRRVVANPQAVVDFAYPWLQHLGWLETLAHNIKQFDATLLGVVDLTKAALPKDGGIYWPAMLLVIGSAASQYYQSKQLMPSDKEARGFRQILRDASNGKQADTAEMNAAMSRSMRFFIPGLIFLFTVSLPSALSLYWFVSGVVAYFQQAHILKQDETEMEAVVDKPNGKKEIIEGEIIQKKTPKKKSSTKGKRRKK
jgi:YidC/Oxa1 family membrane protein insertase